MFLFIYFVCSINYHIPFYCYAKSFICSQLQRQMKIAELKQIFSRPDVVEVGIFFVVYVVLYFCAFIPKFLVLWSLF